MKLDRGIFTLSLDLELIWGTLDLYGPEGFRARCETERRFVIDRLLELLVEFQIPATWCIVGHLFLDHCGSEGGKKHPEIVRPTHSWVTGDWFKYDVDASEETAPVFFGRSVVAKIRACPIPQEIGAHSFSHVIFGDVGCSRETALSEVAACVQAGRTLGITMRSFSFPRNQVGHKEVIRQAGFVCFRGPEPQWYRGSAWPGFLKRAMHLLEVVLATTPPVVVPEQTEQGLWNIPGSMIFFPMHGPRRHIPMSRRVRRALKGLDAARRQNRVFHLWLHPTNLADEMEEMFAGLRAVFSEAADLRTRGLLSIAPMGDLVTSVVHP
jgi:peptidoglycan/xylan/chitin deacetylase (PgdA/CDA1 family)